MVYTYLAETTRMLDDLSSKEFLYWLRKRLVNKYQEDPEILKKIDDIIYWHSIVPHIINPSTIDLICSKYWNTFHEKDNFMLNDIFGGEFYSAKQEEIRNFVISMIAEVFRSSRLTETKKDEHKKDDHVLDEFSFV